MRLNCSISGEFPFYFDEIRKFTKNVRTNRLSKPKKQRDSAGLGAQTAKRQNSSLLQACHFAFFAEDVVSVATENGDVNFYATFTTSLQGLYGSAVCVYSLKAINEIFDRGSFKEQASSSHAWLPVLPTLVPAPRPGQVPTLFSFE